MARLRYTVPFVAAMAFLASPIFVESLTMDYCASMNTAATATNSSIWQSDGLCHDFCVDKSFALAIVQDHDCWCSNYVPNDSTQVDIGKCHNACPGWTPDTCGGDGLYGYILLDTKPSGTADAGSSTAPTPIPTSTRESTSTHVDTASTSTPAVHSTTTTTPIPDTTDAPTTTPPATPVTSVKTVTTGGTVSLQTVTVTPTSTPTSDVGSGASTPGYTSSQHGLSAGAAAGIAIGVLAVVAILAGIAVFFFLRRRRRQRDEEITSRPTSPRSASAGMMSTPTTAMASIWDGENTSTGRRSSRLMPHDPRMDPFATNIYTRFENKSRESINTLQDNQDYSRKVLRTTNPDPPDH
ncbi:hypothetical protein F5Y19DRAFT_471650 [Xylariaceae sp. FL1651]|nr:hypothetical protein F5Y19DRAFT_471650 [Xylariaceae sp. FL1651]